MKLGWVGFHQEGLPALRALLEAGVSVRAVLTLPQELAALRRGAVDYDPLCRYFRVPRYEVADINAAMPQELLRSLELDVLFVIGWSQILEPATLATTRLGVVRARASVVPKKRTGVVLQRTWIPGACAVALSLLWVRGEASEETELDETELMIMPYDTSASLYERLATANRDMLVRLVPQLVKDRATGLASAVANAATGRPGPAAPGGRPGGKSVPGRWSQRTPRAAP